MPTATFVEAARPENASLWTMLKVSAQQPMLIGERKVQPMGGLVDAFAVPNDEVRVQYWTDMWSGVTNRSGERVDGKRKGFVEVML